MPGIGPVAAIVLAKDVEVVQVFVAPVEDDLEHVVEVRQGGVTAHEETAPDERTDLAQDDTQLIDVWAVSGAGSWAERTRSTISLKGSPRNLALSGTRP